MKRAWIGLGAVVRALVGPSSHINERTGAETSQEGAFVSYDKDGKALWMEPQ